MYADVEIHDDWLDQSSDDDTDLCASLLQEPDVEPMDTVSSTNQPPKQVDSPDDVVMDTVSSTHQPPKQVDRAGDDEITLAFDTLQQLQNLSIASMMYPVMGIACSVLLPTS